MNLLGIKNAVKKTNKVNKSCHKIIRDNNYNKYLYFDIR